METRPKIRFAPIIHFRNPHQWYRDPTTLYGEIIDSIVAAEDLGYDVVYLTEHHFTQDDWAPSPLILLSAIAARTTKIRLSTNVGLLPFYHPVRLAEDGAVLDILSGGRYEFQFGLGYRPEEFAAYGMEMKQRSRRADEMLEIIRRLWESETVSFKGRYFYCENATLTPRPVQKPRPPMIVGGFAPNAIKRAARMADGLAGISAQGLRIYHDELRRLGKDPARAKIVGGNPWLYVSRDPDRMWNELAPYVMHAIDCYSQWMKTWNTPPLYPPVANKEELKKTGLLTVLTPAEAVKAVRDQIESLHITTYTFLGNEAACPYHIMREHYELFAKEVIPEIR